MTISWYKYNYYIKNGINNNNYKNMQTCILNQKLWPFTKIVTTSSWWVYHKEKYHLQKKLKIKRTLTYKAKRKLIQ